MGAIVERKLDATGLICPMPVIRTQQTIATLKPGDMLVVTVTDPGALTDIPTWCRVNGHIILSIDQTSHPAEITIEINETDDTVW